MSDKTVVREALELAKLSYASRRCPACERGEATIKPPHSSIVGMSAVHFPSGNVCIVDFGEREYAAYQKLAERLADSMEGKVKP